MSQPSIPPAPLNPTPQQLDVLRDLLRAERTLGAILENVVTSLQSDSNGVQMRDTTLRVRLIESIAEVEIHCRNARTHLIP